MNKKFKRSEEMKASPKGSAAHKFWMHNRMCPPQHPIWQSWAAYHAYAEPQQ